MWISLFSLYCNAAGHLDETNAATAGFDCQLAATVISHSQMNANFFRKISKMGTRWLEHGYQPAVVETLDHIWWGQNLQGASGPAPGGGGGACAVARWREGASSLLMESSGKQVIESAYVVVGSWTAVPWPHRLLVVIFRIICRTTATAASFFTFVHQLARSRLVMCFVDIQCWIQISWSHSNGLWMVSG